MSKHASLANENKLGYSVSELMAVLGIANRNKIYELFHSGALASYTIGARRFCSREAIIAFIRQREKETRAKPIVPRGTNGKTKEVRP